MRVLVTGGAGFIGSHVVEQLVAAHHEVVVVDNFESGRLENLAAVSQKITVIEAELGEWLLQRGECDFDSIVHLAAVPSVQKSILQPLECHRSNYELTLRVAEFAKGSKAHIVFASSAATYGREDNVPILESANTAPISLYGADKLASEMTLAIYGGLYGLKSYSFRFFNVYGTRQDPKSPYSGVLSIFLQKATEGGEFSVYGNGEQSRDFVNVIDIAKVIVEGVQTKPDRNLVINLCTGVEVTLNQVIAILKSVSTYEHKVNYLPSRQGDIVRSCGNPSLLRSWLGDKWSPISIEDGLASLFRSSSN